MRPCSICRRFFKPIVKAQFVKAANCCWLLIAVRLSQGSINLAARPTSVQWLVPCTVTATSKHQLRRFCALKSTTLYRALQRRFQPQRAMCSCIQPEQGNSSSSRRRCNTKAGPIPSKARQQQQQVRQLLLRVLLLVVQRVMLAGGLVLLQQLPWTD